MLKNLSLALVFMTTWLLTACGTSKPLINIPTISEINSVKIAGGLPGSPSAVLTEAQYTSVLAMLQKAKDTGYHTHTDGGYPNDIYIQLTSGRTIMILPAVDMKKTPYSETGIAVKNYVDLYDSADKSNKPQRMYSPGLYNFLTNWQQNIPKSQWQKDN